MNAPILYKSIVANMGVVICRSFQALFGRFSSAESELLFA